MSNAVHAGDLATFSRLLAEHPEQERDDDGHCGWLDSAAYAGHLPIVEFLVARGVDVNERRSIYSVPSPEGVIVSAAQEGHIEVVRWLLDHGAQMNFDISGHIRCSALSRAAMDGHLEVVRLLIERGAVINACWAMHTPLDFAIGYNKNDVADYLRSVGAKTAMELQG